MAIFARDSAVCQRSGVLSQRRARWSGWVCSLSKRSGRHWILARHDGVLHHSSPQPREAERGPALLITRQPHAKRRMSARFVHDTSCERKDMLKEASQTHPHWREPAADETTRSNGMHKKKETHQPHAHKEMHPPVACERKRASAAWGQVDRGQALVPQLRRRALIPASTGRNYDQTPASAQHLSISREL